MRTLTLFTCLTVAVLSAVANPGVAQSGVPVQSDSTRIVSGVPSASQLLGDLEWVVAELAGEKKIWDEKLVPSFEVFLIGIDQERPLGQDFVFDKTDGFRKQWNIPLADLNEFRSENLDPIDIQSRRAGADRSLYSLNSETLDYHGWMRIIDDYALISSNKEDIPANLSSPRKSLEEVLISKGYSAAVASRNTAAGVDDRRESFAVIRKNMLAGITRRPTESREAFELRQALARHQALRMERIFVEAETLTAGWITDKSQKEGRGEFFVAPLPGTNLAEVVKTYGARASYFAGLPKSEAAVVSGRMNIPLDEKLQAQTDEFTRLVNPVWKQRIDGDKELSAAQKSARKQIVDLGLAMLDEGRTVGAIDACIEIVPTADKTHVILCGIRTADGLKSLEILRQIPAAIEGLALEEAIDAVDDFKIHRIKFTDKIPAALKKFYGDSGEIFAAASPEAVWLGAGPDSLAKLKEAIQRVKATPGEPNGEVFYGLVKLGVVLAHLDELAVETGFDFDRFIGRTPSAGGGAGGGNAALGNIDWRTIALPILKKSDQDRFQMEVHQRNGVVEGHAHVEPGVLQAAGKVIAKVAEEKLRD